jgi:stage II sporulation protein AA (anti-sigma F factor antagonist)
MQITETKINSVTVVHVNGRMDAITSGALETKVAGLLDGGSKAIALDLSQLGYISSAGLRVLLTVAKKMKASTAKLALFGLTAEVKQVFDISGFTAILPIFTTQEDAAKAVES